MESASRVALVTGDPTSRSGRYHEVNQRVGRCDVERRDVYPFYTNKWRRVRESRSFEQPDCTDDMLRALSEDCC
jgi:hypothetical protein